MALASLPCLQLLGERIQGLERRLRGKGQPLVKAGEMQVSAVVEDGGESGKADGAAEIAGEIEQAGGIIHALRRQRAECHVVDRDHRRHQADAAEDLRPDELPEVPVAGENEADRDYPGTPPRRKERLRVYCGVNGRIRDTV
ncbi:MAG: hypothetical protein WBE89_19790 [Methyloceanibacter sp.]